jgi:uncharacterized Zn finger protein
MQQTTQPIQGPQLTLEQSTGFECNSCGGLFFKQSLIIRKWSKFLTGQPQDHIEPVPVFRCDDCGDLLKDFLPKGMKDVEEKLGLEVIDTVESSENKKAKLIQM